VFDAQGRRVARCDANGRGWGEWLQPTSIGPGETFLAVREVWVQGQKPHEDVADAYGLVASWGAPAAGWELEPNDWDAVATPLAPGAAVRGYLADPEDQDWFSVVPTTNGKLRLRVAVPAGVDVALSVVPSPGGAGKAASNHGGPGADETLVVTATAGRPVLVRLERKPSGGDAKAEAKNVAPSGWDAPYELHADLVGAGTADPSP
jgi:hypothetical protein